MAKIFKSYILTLSHPKGHVMSAKCDEPIGELAVQVGLLYHHPNFKYCRTLYNHENDDNGAVGVHVDNMTIYNMFESLSKQVENLYTNFNKRISSIEENLELKLTQKLKNAVDNTVRSEVSVVAQEVKDHVADFEMEMRNKVTDVEKKVSNEDRGPEKSRRK